MVQSYTRLTCADNTGARKLMCISVLGGTRRRYARVGDVIVASIKEAVPNYIGEGWRGCSRCRRTHNQRISTPRRFLYQIRSERSSSHRSAEPTPRHTYLRTRRTRTQREGVHTDRLPRP